MQRILFFIGLIFFSTLSFCKDEFLALEISDGKKESVLTRQQLLMHPAKTKVSISNDRAYPNRIMNHEAIPLCQLLAGYDIDQESMIELIATDDFHVYVPARKIMQCDENSAIAMLAIEPDNKWPVINNNTGTTAAPYEIIWLHPEKSYISDEYWAWSVVQIKFNQSLKKDVIAAPETADLHVKNGYQIFISHCEGCHSMNHIGKGRIGPDLSWPKNPWEYYSDRKTLVKFIRDPQSVRHLPKGRMNGSNEQFLSSNDLSDLLNYLAYMLKHKEA